MEESRDYQVLLYYKYVRILDPEAEKERQKNLCEKFDLLGRIIVASEGINGTVEGLLEDTEKYIEEMQKDPRFSDIHWKRSAGTGDAFPKLSVKTRPEIVSLGLESFGVCDVDPSQTTGVHLKPEELHQWIKEDKEFYIVDMRNAYEHKLGYFEGSVLPPMKNFRDLPKVVKQLAHLKNKTVLTVCTGGVRCEKASGFLITQGFTDVYQLDGGIVSYMERYPNEDFKGKLYVFDGRITQGFYTDDPAHEVVAKCDVCGEASENYVNCANLSCHRHFVACEACIASSGGAEQKDRNRKTAIGIRCPGGCTISRHGRPVEEIVRQKESLV